MTEEYKKILNLSLSGLKIEEKIIQFETLWSMVNEELLFRHAKVDEVASHIAYILKSSNLKYASYWDREYEEVNQRVSVLMHVLDEIGKKLKENDIEIVALKNAGIAKAIFKNNACSPMGDLDLLIRSKDFRNAHEIILKELGFTFKFRSEFEEEDLEDAFRGGGTEYYKIVEIKKLKRCQRWGLTE